MKKLLNLLARKSSSGHFIPEIDGLRFVAIISVILYHLNGYLIKKTSRSWDPDLLSKLLDKGSIGVQLFFAISGFIIAYPFIKAKKEKRPAPALKKYFIRRLTRLEPTYIISLLACFGLSILLGKYGFSDRLPNLFASLFYAHNLVYSEPSLINAVAWSLEIEFQFYVFAPLLLALFLKWQSITTRQILLLTLIFILSFCEFDKSLSLTIVQQIPYFLAGFLLCDIYINRWNETPKYSYYADLLGLACWIGVPTLMGTPYQGLLPILTLIAYGCVFRGKIIRSFFIHPFTYTVGGMCYTIYLWHFLVISLAGRMTMRLIPFGFQPFWLEIIILSAIVLPCILIVCSVLFVLTEKPFMDPKWPQKLKKLFSGKMI